MPKQQSLSGGLRMERIGFTFLLDKVDKTVVLYGYTIQKVLGNAYLIPSRKCHRA